jgi:hypothetical protein
MRLRSRSHREIFLDNGCVGSFRVLSFILIAISDYPDFSKGGRGPGGPHPGNAAHDVRRGT